ncbi:class I SAM-dependent methyltransferase [Marinobacterium sediminicola]|uniref:23S rRNA (Cytosine1962-C5)-methyltransferase n=1 Tax=Marinobacterium sediminicola TaxID=518898 RepID=A0ABY1RZF1_9GAMM|nr:class I SAM-dependent methyltransferase [Marinobacterium sediminicola]ULG67972.1 class I SAM-dependent methyltransferase [Marinobacterium sediminicola]SMR73520.1 23S rRNA (cytosine1962-C5)-methyltransferase [Marinobacterium sediminicola]
MQSIIEWMEQQLRKAEGESRRLFHGRGGMVPGYEWLVVDWLPPVAVIRVYKQPAEPVEIDRVISWLSSQVEIEAVVWQARGVGAEGDVRVLQGEVPERHVIREAGLHYQVDALAPQNSGLFLDMRPGRQWVRDHAQGARVLNLFAYTCAFSVAAVAGGAACVVNVDMSSRALSAGRQNHRLNQQEKADVRYLAVNLLKSWSRVRKPGPYELVVIDPPSFQPGSFVAVKDYIKVLRRLPELTVPGSKVVLCHNDPKETRQFLEVLMEENLPDFTCIECFGAGEDFPELGTLQGLKVTVYQREELTA